MPSAIICACDNDTQKKINLRIVDGQHRVHAFRQFRELYGDKYNEIKAMQVPVIVLENVDQSTEIETFITINKTSKKLTPHWHMY